MTNFDEFPEIIDVSLELVCGLSVTAKIKLTYINGQGWMAPLIIWNEKRNKKFQLRSITKLKNAIYDQVEDVSVQ